MKKLFFLLSLFFIVFLNRCDIFDGGCMPISYAFKFSIKNETTHKLSAKLIICEIPRADANYDEYKLIPDEVYKLLNEIWSSELGTSCTINPGMYGIAYNHVPFINLKPYIGDQIDDQRLNILYENIMNKYFSFIFTIKQGDDIVYRVVGWDVPDDDMVKYHINDKMYGYYFTAEENFTGNFGSYPSLTSKLFSDGTQTYFISSVTYYIKARSSGISLIEFDSLSLHVSDNDFWRTH